MTTRTATADPNYQALAAEFSVGDLAAPFGQSRDMAGRVTAVWPAIGMVDVQFPRGNIRIPVEDAQRFNNDGIPQPTHTDTTPGGQGTVPVSGGPYVPSPALASRVALAHEKQSMYWADVNRRYKATKSEQETGDYKCPKCLTTSLKHTSYKRTDGKNVKLLGCPDCLFLIKPSDLMGCHLAPVEEI